MPLKDLLAIALLLLLGVGAWWRQREIKRAVASLERDPDTQYQVHRVATWYWVVNFPVVAVLFFGFPELWVRLGLLLNTFYSLYANLSTDYGAMSAALAARRTSQPLELVETLRIVRQLRAHQRSTCRHCRSREASSDSSDDGGFSFDPSPIVDTLNVA